MPWDVIDESSAMPQGQTCDSEAIVIADEFLFGKHRKLIFQVIAD
jgi:hypothetical protein